MITYTITFLLIYHGSVIYPISGKYAYMIILIYNLRKRRAILHEWSPRVRDLLV